MSNADIYELLTEMNAEARDNISLINDDISKHKMALQNLQDRLETELSRKIVLDEILRSINN